MISGSIVNHVMSNNLILNLWVTEKVTPLNYFLSILQRNGETHDLTALNFLKTQFSQTTNSSNLKHEFLHSIHDNL